MIIDKIKTPDEIKMLLKLHTGHAGYVNQIALNIPPPLKKLVADVITVLLTKINVTHEEIDTTRPPVLASQLGTGARTAHLLSCPRPCDKERTI